MKNKIIQKSFLLVFFGIFALMSPAQAARSIDVDGADDHMLSADNIYPGYSKDKTVKISNTGDEPVDVYFKFDLDGDDFLADKLKLYVIRKSDSSYRAGGSGDRMTLDDADGDKLFIDRLSVDEDQDYKIKITFDENAGNEYQDKEADFDILLGFDAEEATPANPPLRAGFTGQGPEEEVAGISSPEGEVGGEEELAGAQSEVICKNWPLWAAILALLIFTAVMAKYLYGNYTKGKTVWKFGLLLVAASIALWYWADECREFQWFLNATVIIAAISYFIYLKALGEKIKSAGE